MKTFANIKDFDAVTLKLASPDDIRSWSYGEVTKPETINYRTGRSERGGLFDERIFGPEKDYECYCGKYRRIRYKDIICEKCGVEVTRSIVRRERMGHIELAFPVAHIWFVRGIPSKMGMLLDLSVADLEKVIYFAGYIITSVNEEEKTKISKELNAEYKTKSKQFTDTKDKENLKELFDTAKRELDSLVQGTVIDEVSYHRFSLKYGQAFEADIGAEAVYRILAAIDMQKLQDELAERIETAGAERTRLARKLSMVKAMIQAGVRPEWMFLSAIPIIPPALRPMVALEGGRHATSDVNDLYRRVINRNNRLKKLKELSAPDVILRNEKRILQEAVDALIDNSIRHGVGSGSAAAMSSSQKRTLKSLADALKGKHGLFRQNLLGKRVDYSGRSVIVVGPDLKLHQCGLPKHMALELFRPFVISKLLAREFAFNIRGAGRLMDEGVPEVWAILEEVIADKYVLLNRAPTLHRLGIQAFQPVLIEGNAIQVHPLVCTAFNADFDGDQMAVHVPLSEKAQYEAREMMSAAKNLLKPGNGDPIVNPSLDIVLGCFWMTKIVSGEKGEGKVYPSPNSAITAYDFGDIGFRAKIQVLGTDSPKYAAFEGKSFETTVGRLFFNSVLPKDFPYLNKEITKKIMGNLVEDIIATYSIAAAPPILDKIKAFGYRYVTKSGITWGIDDVIVPAEKKEIVGAAREKERIIIEQFNEGLLSEEERYRKVIEIWQGAIHDIEEKIPGTLASEGSANDMLSSGARGSLTSMVQMSGMKGIIINTAGLAIDFPVVPSYKEGLSPIEYFVTTHGSRKGLTDTALNTAKAGYLTRRLVNVAQDVVIIEEDCGTKKGRLIGATSASGITVSLAKNIRGRVLAEDAAGYKKGELVTKDMAAHIEESGVLQVLARSPLSCDSLGGICQKCYGRDLGRDGLVNIGEPVGVIAAQAIGEPGTQLTMRTFHSGGIASVGGDITMGLPRVEEVFERRIPKIPAVISISDGEVMEIEIGGKETLIRVLADETEKKSVKDGSVVEYTIPFRRMALVKKGDRVLKGKIISDGKANLQELFKYAGRDVTENYIIDEIIKVYELQAASISRKHIELIVRQMFSRVRVKHEGDTRLTPGDIVLAEDFEKENERIRTDGGMEAKAETVLLGISEVTLSTPSFLSAASFQHTSRTLINTAIRGGVDMLRGLNENVAIGRLIPAGTGYHATEEEEEEDESENARK
ncbi:MAG: DNA-directed RNA polymerase subunit beta' [Candidatus Lloydbacteria bacterium CG22_combo_CG10-13_8_21_14_all_47_15]|uniref:DNA-directed RNA polymerase subunit beta' n=1 Tax=Candidatus Lloydbacteria bacterium CG22_combo_CG10-13_8_21_14_all_47_15 TaxID=1974635 RepID=A0A2H0CSW8_9BACT|nr:MAG: DNA-directed RNA polymerase subunit beta' [Candidatus Lloydbacteria bacterium CG22_combo_CG10-13_8_21_14_all_47_15]